MIESWFEQDLMRMVPVRSIGGHLFTSDSKSNLIGVKVKKNGEPLTLAGTITAKIIRADGYTVTASGSKSGNTAYIILPADAYAVAGPISIVLKNVDNGVTTTLLAIESTVYRAGT